MQPIIFEEKIQSKPSSTSDVSANVITDETAGYDNTPHAVNNLNLKNSQNFKQKQKKRKNPVKKHPVQAVPLAMNRLVETAIRYSVWESRPRAVFGYSLNGKKITFDYNQLHKARPIRVPFPPKSLKAGVNGYERPIYSKKSSKCRRLLLTLVAYESINNIKPMTPSNIEIICHNGFHNDLNTLSGDVYTVVLYKNRLIFANTDTRENQNKLLSYIGIKFESMLQKKPSPKDGSHYKNLLVGQYGRWNFKSVVEVDGYVSPKFVHEMDENERMKSFCEIKVCNMAKVHKNDLKDLDKYQFLLKLKKSVKGFGFKVKKWLYQSYFGRQDILIIGIRNEKMELVYNMQLSLLEDLIPFVESEFNSIYKQFIKSVDNLDEKYETIIDKIKDLQTDQRDIFRLKCSKDLQITKISRKDKHDIKFEEMIIPEYLDWIDHGKDTLASTKDIDTDAYNNLKMGNLNEKMAALDVSKADDVNANEKEIVDTR